MIEDTSEHLQNFFEVCGTLFNVGEYVEKKMEKRIDYLQEKSSVPFPPRAEFAITNPFPVDTKLNTHQAAAWDKEFWETF